MATGDDGNADKNFETPLRVHFGLKAMLLSMAIVAPIFALIGAHSQINRIEYENRQPPSHFYEILSAADSGAVEKHIVFRSYSLGPQDADAIIAPLVVWMQERPEIVVLDLSNMAATDAGIAYLFPMKHLRKIHLHRTMVTSNGVQQLQAALPQCKIYYP